MPNARARVVVLAAMALSGLTVLTKLFSTVAWLADEPTVVLALRARPGLTNELKIADEAELRGMTVLLTDENRFVGQGAYEVVTGVGWLVGCAVIVGGAGYLLATGRRSLRE